MKKLMYILIGFIIAWIVVSVYQNLNTYETPVIYSSDLTPDRSDIESNCIGGGHPLDPIC